MLTLESVEKSGFVAENPQSEPSRFPSEVIGSAEIEVVEVQFESALLAVAPELPTEIFEMVTLAFGKEEEVLSQEIAAPA